MATHTEAEMEQMTLADLRKHADEPTPPVVENPPATMPAENDEPEIFVARRELDLGEGAGVEVFEAEGETREEALEALTDKIADAKKNATKKIRDQETELKDLRLRTTPKPESKKMSDDEKYIFQQEFQKDPDAALEKWFEHRSGRKPEDLGEVWKRVDAATQAERTNQAISTFVQTHPDYEDNEAKGGTKNGQLMRMKLAEMGLPVTSENLSKAYSQLKQSGLLLLKGEEANADTTEKTEEPGRIVPPKVEPAQTRTRKTSTISTHNRAPAVPVNTEPSEDEQYTMPMDKLRQLANKALSGVR